MSDGIEEREPGGGGRGGSADSAAFPTEIMGEPNFLRRFCDEDPGAVIGHYRLVEKLGEGGFGVVWLAEQDAPVRRNVALKIIKLGMDTRDIIARFERERQALAMMDHPNIARVFDAGATPAGRPYFVMEYVRGVRITEYCDRNALPIAERLKLFIAVCHAVQHAHQKGIIHRDIKPSNILVTVHDGEPLPKIIDFGVAKATMEVPPDSSLVTQLEDVIGTPAYMSPEQAGGELDIDTRTDIYALGVVLYELLTGRTPFESSQLARAGREEMRRIIREQEPRKPSLLLGSIEDGTLTATAVARRTESPRLLRDLRGDLDWIVMKALEKERARRYASATAFAEDIVRNLRLEAVSARPPSLLYRAERLVQRNKLAVAATALVAVSMLAGTATSTVLYFRERRALETARVEATKSREVATFLGTMLAGVGPSVAMGRDTTLLREILDRASTRVESELKNEPDVNAQLRVIIGNVYRDVGRPDKAEAMQREALALRLRAFGRDHPSVATSYNNLANSLADEGRLQEAEDLHREALALRRRLLGEEHADVAHSLNNLANVLTTRGRLAEAEDLHRRALALRRRLLGTNHTQTVYSLNNLANTLYEERKLAEAEALHRQVLASRQAEMGREHPEVARSLLNLGVVLGAEGRLEEAEIRLREALAMERRLLGPEHPDLALALRNLANVLRNAGQGEEAEALYREALAVRRTPVLWNHADTAVCLDALADLLRVKGNLSEAEALYREELSMRRGLSAAGEDLSGALQGLARVLRAEGRQEEADALAPVQAAGAKGGTERPSE